MTDLFSLTGEVAFVTGAGSGIGQRVAVGLAEAGADVGCFDLASSAGLSETISRIEALGCKGVALHGDVTDEEALGAAIAAMKGQFGRVSRAVNCAGIANANPAETMSRTQWQRMFDVNVTGVFLSCQAEARAMLEAGGGSIVNIAFMSGVIVNRGLLQAHYNSAKAAVIHLSKSLAMEWIERGIRVNSISPGYTATAMNIRAEVADQVKQFEADTPMGRMASVDELVGPAVFLSSKAASFVTGVDLLVDGGFCCW